MLQVNAYWLYYHLADDEHTYQEGPFSSFAEARRVAREADQDLYPVDIWIQTGFETVWRQTRRTTARAILS